MASGAMPVPPDVRAQGQPPAPAGPSINRPAPAGSMPPNGPSQEDYMASVEKSMKQFEDSTSQLFALMSNADPQSKALFMNLAEVGQAIKQRVAQLKQKTGQGAATPEAVTQATNPAEAPPGPVAAEAPPEAAPAG